MSIINVTNLKKIFLVAQKQPGLRGTLKHFVKREVSEISAVNDVSFDIEQGEIVGFIGPNGAGKTTTLKILCGLIFPSSGFTRVIGHTPHKRKVEFLRNITLVMGQKQQLLWDLPPMDSLKVNAAVYGIDDLEAKRRINELSEMLELGPELYRPVRKLSLGQRMKAELLASLIHKPTVLFLDEPTLGLDVNSQIRVRQFLIEYNQKYSSTIILTSHYMGDITSLCKRIIVIDHGKLSYDGDINELTRELRPYKRIKITTDNKLSLELLKGFEELEDFSDYSFTLLVRRDVLPKVLSKLLDTFPVKDLEVKDPPIERLIGDLFTNSNIYKNDN